MSTLIEKLILAGRADQRLLEAGRILARAGLGRGLEVTWVPDTGPQGAGLGAVCTVILAGGAIASPLVSVPDAVLALEAAARDRLLPSVKAGGLMVEAFADLPGLTPAPSPRDDVRRVHLPAAREAAAAGCPGREALVALGAFGALSALVGMDDLAAGAAAELGADEAARVAPALARGAAWVRERRYMKERYALSIFPT